jgi:hypothetical protein
MSAIESVRDRMSYMIVRGHRYEVIVLNVHAPKEEEIYCMCLVLYCVCKELGHVFNKFSKYCMKILLADFSAKVDKKDIFKPTVGNESLHKISNDNGVRVVNFTTFKKLSKVQYSHSVTYINLFEHFLMGRHKIKLSIFLETGDDIIVYLMSSHSWQQSMILTIIGGWQKLERD